MAIEQQAMLDGVSLQLVCYEYATELGHVGNQMKSLCDNMSIMCKKFLENCSLSVVFCMHKKSY